MSHTQSPADSPSSIESETEVGTMSLEEQQAIAGEVAVAVLPVISAGLSLVKAPGFNATTKTTIGSWNTPANFPATPQQLFDDSTFTRNGLSRYPATGYLSDFYALGDLAYMTMTQSDDAWGDFLVKLYIYPALSYNVQYTLEQYRVPAGDWTCVADRLVGCDVLDFEALKTFYFDLRVESRRLLWNTYSNSAMQVYDLDGFPEPRAIDFSDSVFDYPTQIVDQEPSKLNQLSGEYSSYTSFDVDSDRWDCDSADQSNSFCTDEEGQAFYAELLNDAEIEKYSKTYSTSTVTYDSGPEQITNWVRLHHTYSNDDQITKSKGMMDYQTTNYSEIMEIQDTIIVADTEDNGRTDFNQVISTKSITTTGSKNKKTNSYEYVATLDLEETSSGADEYSGSYTVVYPKKTYSYSATITAGNGLVITSLSTTPALVKTAVDESSATLKFDFSAGTNEVTIVLDSGKIVGIVEGNLLQGTFTSDDGMVSTLLAGYGFAYFGEESSNE